MGTDLELVRVRDQGILLEIPFEACRLYHGEDSIGGLALGFRLVAWTLHRLSPDEVPERSEVSFRTAFPGPGIRDALEMTVRAVSRGAWEVLDTVPPGVPEGVYGHFYFEMTVRGRTLCVSVKPGVISRDFIRTGRAVKAGDRSAERLSHWVELKRELAATVLSCDMDRVLVVHSQPA